MKYRRDRERGLRKSLVRDRRCKDANRRRTRQPGVAVIAEALRTAQNDIRTRSLGIRQRDGPARERARFGGRGRGFRRETGRRWCGWDGGRDSCGALQRRSVKFAAARRRGLWW